MINCDQKIKEIMNKIQELQLLSAAKINEKHTYKNLNRNGIVRDKEGSSISEGDWVKVT